MTLHEKRYQVFISSSFEDLKEERRAVQDVIINTGDFPVQMESFPAADEDQFEFIKSLIDRCDYYVLVIAGRYSTVVEDGMSYTEKEYRYAVSKGVPILVMVHDKRGSISHDKSEKTEEGSERLERFIEEASKGRLRKNWDTTDSLKLAVREALDHAKATKPRVGWVRGDQVPSREILEELNDVRKESARLRDRLGDSAINLRLPEIPSIEELLEIDLVPNTSNSSASLSSYATIRCSWIAVFPLFLNNMEWVQNEYFGHISYFVQEEDSCVKIGSALAAEVSKIDTDKRFKIKNITLKKLSSYFIECGFMRRPGEEEPFTDIAEKIARRQMVAIKPVANFEVVTGDLTAMMQELDLLSGDLIPF